MSSPETDWVDGIIPPAHGYRVVHRYLGLFDAGLYLDADACFAANATCRRVYARHPLDQSIPFHCRPVCPQPHGQSASTADLHDGVRNHANAISDGDDDATGSASGSGQGDEDRGSDAPRVSRGDGHAGHAGPLLLADPTPITAADAELPDVQHTSAGPILSKEGDLT